MLAKANKVKILSIFLEEVFGDCHQYFNFCSTFPDFLPLMGEDSNSSLHILIDSLKYGIFEDIVKTYNQMDLTKVGREVHSKYSFINIMVSNLTN